MIIRFSRLSTFIALFVSYLLYMISALEELIIFILSEAGPSTSISIMILYNLVRLPFLILLE
jgi:hypothetical protein